MDVRELLSDFEDVVWGEDSDQQVQHVLADHREIGAGDVFVAIRGARFDGHQVLPEVVKKKPVALIVEALDMVPKDYKGTVAQVLNSRQALDSLAHRFYGTPSSQLFCVGVTGTNGKTTVTHMIEHLLNQSGLLTGVMGTIDHHIGQKIWKTGLTTPDPVALQSRLADFCNEGAKAAALEVSSHAIEQARANSLQLDVAVFTNLSRDHLDYHKDMETYFKAKERLFSQILQKSTKRKKWAIVNTDDEWGKRISLHSGVTRWTYGKSSSEFQYKCLATSFEGLEASLQTPQGDIELSVPMVGEYNLANAVAALAVAVAAGLDLSQAANHLRSFPGVAGRLERVSKEQRPYVFVDYAHTPDALENVLLSLQEVRRQSGTEAKIHCLFGCGGDRDKGKRPLMGTIASRFADEVWVTSDNPRTEDPGTIMEDILFGIDDSGDKVHIVLDREEAITKCISQAHCDDVILIAGKGHEDYQIIGEERRPFSDFEVARKALDEKTI